MSTCFLSVVITVSEQVAPLAVAQSIIVTFLTNKNMKVAEILTTSEQCLVTKRSKGLRCMAGISYLKKAGQWLKRCHMHDWEHVNQSNAVQINSLTQDNRQITVHEPAKIVEVNFSTVSSSITAIQ
jgi:hypothetical protein